MWETQQAEVVGMDGVSAAHCGLLRRGGQGCKPKDLLGPFPPARGGSYTGGSQG